MSFWNFSPAKPQQQQQQAPANQGGGNGNNQPNLPQGNGSPMPNNPNNQPNGQNSGNQQPVNPLDSYSKLFDNPSTEEGKPPSFAIDPKIMDEVVGSQDFTKGINPELIQKATSGDAQAMLEIIQGVGRNSYRAAIEHGGMLTDKFVGAREQYGQKGLRSSVREELTTHALSNTPNFQHPVVKKQLIQFAKQFQTQHPDASPEEIATMAKQYISDLQNALNPDSKDGKQNQKETPAERGEDYWNSFFDEQPQS